LIIADRGGQIFLVGISVNYTGKVFARKLDLTVDSQTDLLGTEAVQIEGPVLNYD